MTIHLIVGLPAAGKTRRARELEISESALRLSPDEWFTAVFPADGPTAWRTPERVEQRDLIEGRLVGLGIRAAQLGLDVVLDFGLWGRDERSALRWIAESVGTRASVVYLPVEPDEQRRRVTERSRSGPGQFAFEDAELEQWREQFEEPDDEELHGTRIPPVPVGHATWWAWAYDRWPSLPRS